MTEIEVKKLADLKPDQANANRGTERGRAMLESSLRQWGAGRSILLDRKGRIIAGNKTFEEAGQIGLEDVIVVRTQGDKLVAVLREDLDLADDATGARELAYADNRVGQVSLDWQPEQILADLDSGLNLTQFWSEGELNAILAGLTPEPKPDPGPQVDKAAQLAEKWGTQTGQVWQLGEHRLAVGDCTDKAVVEAVMQGERAEMMFTDPPYGVDYTGGHWHSGNVNIKRERPRLINDKIEIYSLFLPIVLPFIDGPCYVWFADRGGKPVYDAIIDNDCEIHAMLIWNKINATYAAMNAQYKQRHEPCMYFKPKRTTLRWVGPTDECTVWDEKRDPSNDYHPTQKPLVLPIRAIRNHDAQIVIDPFLGSGTTLIACEQLKRKCRAIEIDPGYCAVAIQRWADLTGREPALLSE